MEEVRLSVWIDSAKRQAFKSKAAADYLDMRDVVAWMIDDYLSGKWKPRPRDRQKSEAVIEKRQSL